MRNYKQTGPRFTVTGGHAVAVRDQERDSSRVEHPWEQVHEQTTQERKVVLKPRAGVVSARALLPLVAATSSFPPVLSLVPQLLLLPHLMREQPQPGRVSWGRGHGAYWQ